MVNMLTSVLYKINIYLKVYHKHNEHKAQRQVAPGVGRSGVQPLLKDADSFTVVTPCLGVCLPKLDPLMAPKWLRHK